jgi:lipopolysaccharide/colanic/teichoic acid biosynthesis glycosyltransferase
MTRFPFLKRVGDIMLSATALILLVPVLAVVWGAVRVVIGRPMFSSTHGPVRAGGR